jgi:hypothetical protein
VPLMKADALDFALMRLEAMVGPGDGAARAGEEGRSTELGGGPGDVLVPFDEVIPEVGVLDSAPRAPATSGGHFADGSTATA